MESDRKPSVMMRKFLDYNPSVRRSAPLYKPLPDKAPPFEKELYFFYGTLMDPNTLSEVLGTQGRPEIKPAKLFGYRCKLWGPHPALVDEISREAVHVKNVEEKQKLVEYNGAHYSLIPCKIDIGDGSRVWDVLSSGRMMSHALGKGLLISEFGESSSEVANVLKMAGYGSRYVTVV